MLQVTLYTTVLQVMTPTPLGDRLETFPLDEEQSDVSALLSAFHSAYNIALRNGDLSAGRGAERRERLPLAPGTHSPG